MDGTGGENSWKRKKERRRNLASGKQLTSFQIKKILKRNRLLCNANAVMEEELAAIRENNHAIIKSLQDEKLKNAELMQQRSEMIADYHRVVDNKIATEEELRKWKARLKETDTSLTKYALPYLVELTNIFGKVTVQNSEFLMNTHTVQNNEFLMNTHTSHSRRSATHSSFSSSFPDNTFDTSQTQPTKRVLPMINGCPITKPTINIPRLDFARVSRDQRREAAAENRSRMYENIDVPSPLVEETSMEEAAESTANRRSEGTLRLVLSLPILPKKYRGNCDSASSLPEEPQLDSRSSDSGTESDEYNSEMIPVVRLSDVTRMLRHTTSLTVPCPNPSAGNSSHASHKRQSLSSKQSNSADDPLEGCSWMYREPIPREECTSAPNISQVDETESGSVTLSQSVNSTASSRENNTIRSCQSSHNRSSTTVVLRNDQQPVEDSSNSDVSQTADKKRKFFAISNEKIKTHSHHPDANESKIKAVAPIAGPLNNRTAAIDASGSNDVVESSSGMKVDTNDGPFQLDCVTSRRRKVSAPDSVNGTTDATIVLESEENGGQFSHTRDSIEVTKRRVSRLDSDKSEADSTVPEVFENVVVASNPRATFVVSNNNNNNARKMNEDADLHVNVRVVIPHLEEGAKPARKRGRPKKPRSSVLEEPDKEYETSGAYSLSIGSVKANRERSPSRVENPANKKMRTTSDSAGMGGPTLNCSADNGRPRRSARSKVTKYTEPNLSSKLRRE